MLVTDFLARYYKYPEYRIAEQIVDKNWLEWLPVIAGIVTFTNEEVQLATAEQEMILAVVSNKRLEYMRGGV